MLRRLMILKRLAAAAEVGLEVAVATFYWSSTRLLLLLFESTK
jgi:hypothetical protein